MDELTLDNILGEEEIDSLFTDDSDLDNPGDDNKSEETGEDDKDKKNNNKDTIEDINADTLFDVPESVGSDEDTKEKKDPPSKKDGPSPKNPYSSIAEALKEEGVFPDLSDEDLSEIKDSESFRNMIDSQIRAGLDERQKRIDEALNVGIETSEIRKYENTIGFLDSIKEENLTDESDQGENLRKNLIYQDFINRGYSEERAKKEVQKSLNAGTDIDDAKEALQSNIDYFKEKYDNLIKDARQKAEKDEEDRKKQGEKLKESILNDKDVFGDLVINKSVRQKIYDNIAKPIYKDPDTGEYLTAIQKYEMDNRVEFLKNLGLVFTLTDGFKNFNNLIEGKVKKEVKRGLKNLENVINNTSRTPDGNLKFVGDSEDDPESFIGKGWKLDV